MLNTALAVIRNDQGMVLLLQDAKGNCQFPSCEVQTAMMRTLVTEVRVSTGLEIGGLAIMGSLTTGKPEVTVHGFAAYQNGGKLNLARKYSGASWVSPGLLTCLILDEVTMYFLKGSLWVGALPRG